MITHEVKKKIIAAMQVELERQGTQAKLARKLGISASQVTRTLKGATDGVLSKGNWFSIARRLDVHLGSRIEIKAAKTQTFTFINSQLSDCQQNSISLVLCDDAGIGKTFAARHYIRTAADAVYIDCSQVKSKQRLVRQICKEFGLTSEGRYADIYQDLVHYLKATPNALVILDEAGDLDYPAFLELKALWNATEHITGWYMMGADGLREKIDRNKGRKKVGFAEIFRRYGEKYQKVTPDGGEDAKAFHKKQVALVAQANGVSDVQGMYAKTQGSLTRVYLELQKLKAQKTA